MTRTGLALDSEKVDLEAWGKIGAFLGGLSRANSWWCADWLNHGEAAYGEKHSQHIEATGLAFKTLANMSNVGRKVDSSRRRDSLSFAHHAAVAKLDPENQTHWLETAEREGLTRGELRASIKAGKVIRKDEMKPSSKGVRNLSAWMGDAAAWLDAAEASEPLEDWSPSKRLAVLKQIEPIISLARRLTGEAETVQGVP